MCSPPWPQRLGDTRSSSRLSSLPLPMRRKAHQGRHDVPPGDVPSDDNSARLIDENALRPPGIVRTAPNRGKVASSGSEDLSSSSLRNLAPEKARLKLRRVILPHLTGTLVVKVRLSPAMAHQVRHFDTAK